MFPLAIITGKAKSGKDTVADMMKKYGGQPMALADEMKRFCFHNLGFTEEELWGPSQMRGALYRGSKNLIDDDGNIHGNGESWLYTLNMQAHRIDFCKWWDDHVKFNEKPTLRHILQTLGTEWGRACNDNIWIDHLLNNLAIPMLMDGGVYSRVGGYTYNLGFKREYPEFITITDGRFHNEILSVKKLGGIAIKVVNPEGGGLEGSAANHASEVEQDLIPEWWYDVVIVNDKSKGLDHLSSLVNLAIGKIKNGQKRLY